MYNTNKSQSKKYTSILISLFVLIVFVLPASAVDLPFDPNDYNFLIYVPNPDGAQDSIRAAMEHLGIPYDWRDDDDEVTSSDLETHDILIVGWNYSGDTDGLDDETLAAGINGRVILTGHDADFHTVYETDPDKQQAAETMLVQAIDYVLAGGTTGMIALGCLDEFPYLPEEWGVNAASDNGDNVSEFTSEGLASGVYNGLEPSDMSDWGQSYHDVFDIDSNSLFVQFELGGDGDDKITIARLSSGYGVELTKTDDVNDGFCVEPGDEIIYTINYSYPNEPNSPDFNDVNLIDYLPGGVEYLLSDPCGAYNSEEHTVTWNIGILEPNESNSVMLTVRVNECIPECGVFINFCRIKSGDLTLRWTREKTPICSASNPSPACGEIVDLYTADPYLTWCPGHFAANVDGHEVYFGDNFDDVNDANNSDPNVYKDTVTNPSYPIELNSLDVDTTYYWRIDEVNSSHPDGRWKGGVWSFKTCNYFLLENFNSYAVTSSLRQTWKDFFGNGTSAEVYIDSDTVIDGKSMRYYFGNDDYPEPYSEAYADIDNLPGDIGPDWTAYGIESLALHFYGVASNPVTEQMYLILADGDDNSTKLMYNGDINDLTEEKWHQWNILLQDFVDINLANVSRITIGFGDETWGNHGEVYFEDIRLYLSRCIPGYYPIGDFESDCDVDLSDFAVLAFSWLTSSEDPNYNPICDISVPVDEVIDEYDLARFCDYWLWQSPSNQSYPLMMMGMGSGYGQDSGFTETMTSSSQALDTESIYDTAIEEELLSTEEIKIMIEWLQSLLTDEQVKENIKGQQGEQEWQNFVDMIEEWIKWLEAQL